MKKLLLTLGLIGLGFGAFSQKNDSIKNAIFDEIDSTRVFEFEKGRNYCRGSEIIFESGEACLSYDFNYDWSRYPEILAYFKIITGYGGYYKWGTSTPLYVYPYAKKVIIDKNEDGIDDIIYTDENGDGYLETKRKGMWLRGLKND